MKQNPLHPKTVVTVGDRTYTLLFDFESVALAEELTDRPLLTGLRKRDITTPTISLVRAMFFACLQPNHPQLAYDDVKAMVTRKNIGDLWVKVLEAWTSGLAEADPEGEDGLDADPNQDQS